MERDELYGNDRTRRDPTRKAYIAKAENAMAEISTKQKTVLCALQRSGNAMGKMILAESAMVASATGDRIENICDAINRIANVCDGRLEC